MSTSRLDVLVVGSGVAGLSAAVRLAALGAARVGVLTKGALEQSTTRFAQGGVAAVLPGDEDSTDRHLADTLRAGAGLCDERAVRVLVDEGPARVIELIALGAAFDRLPNGDLARALEGGHSNARVIHAGGTATGAEVERALVAAVERSAAAIFEHHFALDLVVEHSRAVGVVALDRSGRPTRIDADHVLVATGGAGQLYSVTTNPDEATGDGIAMALRAGVLVTDVEFVQFHPTALHHPVMPRPLLSEALRGHGAVLRGEGGERFVDELQPRDVVSQAIARELERSGREHVWLDATELESFEQRFPTIHGSLAAAGLDPTREWLPVAPAAHYLSGGIATDLDGATELPGLFAAGEAACTGVHGANRLASNSLLDGMVFGARVVDAILAGRSGPSETGILAGPPALPIRRLEKPSVVAASGTGNIDLSAARRQLQQVMTAGAGIVRDAASLAEAAKGLDELAAPLAGSPGGSGASSSEAPSAPLAELANLLTLGRCVVTAATVREESRGAHARSDFPGARDELRIRLGFAARRPGASAPE